MSNPFFGFDDNEAQALEGIDLSAADDKTLRLAVHPFSEEELVSLKRFQETYIAHGEAHPGAEALAKAHTEAMKVCGLEPKRVEQGLALLRLFCGKRNIVQRLRARLPELEAAGPAKAEVCEKALSELERLERETDNLARRFGQETVALLRQHEPELLALHDRLTHMTLNRA